MKENTGEAEKTGKRFQCGFTLLELMISMSLTAILLSMLSAGLYSVVNEWRKETSVLDDTLDKSLVILQLERALLAAFPHSFVDQERLARFVYFKGTENGLRWVSSVSPQRRTGLTAWNLQSDPKEGLKLSLTPAYSDNPDARFEEIEPFTILKNYRAEFQYLLQQNEDEKVWLDEWEGEEMQSLPIAVHVILYPIDEEQDEEILEILAPIKTHDHEDIPPTTPVI